MARNCGSNRICSVPQCKNRAKKGAISLHKFPTDGRLKKEWAVKLRIGKPVTKEMMVCSVHFTPRDFFWNTTDPSIWTPCRKRLKRTAVPSKCLPTRRHDFKDPAKEQASFERASRAATRSASALATNIQAGVGVVTPCPSASSPHQVNDQGSAESDNLCPASSQGATEAAEALLLLRESIADIPSQERSALGELFRLSKSSNADSLSIGVQVNTDSAPRVKATLLDLLTTNSAVKAFTGVETRDLLITLAKGVEKHDNMNSECSVLARVTLVLVRLKTLVSFKCLAILFGISDTTVHRYFYATLRVMAAVLEAAVTWPSKAEVLNNEPKCFAAYRDVRVVLDCTEVEVEKSHCASCRILTYSHYKGTHTLKVLIGVSPGGLITFVSDCFGGRASDKACVGGSEVLEILEPFKDDVMVDKGFNIHDKCTALGIGVVQPPFLRKQAQFSREDAEKTIRIARARVHVERAIQRLKLYRILKGPLPWEMLAVADEMMVVIAGIVNLSAPILAGKRFSSQNIPIS